MGRLGIGEDSAARMRDFLRQAGGCAVIDGGLATELEAGGADLNDPLWSAKCLIDSPDRIRKVHLDYLEAGANVLITSSYQATIQGLQSRGFSAQQGEALLRRSVEIACEARDVYLERNVKGSRVVGTSANEFACEHHPVLIAASIGSYGAYLADGSEYSGEYGKAITVEWLKDFHRRRLLVLAESGADIIAFETIPNKIEAQAYVELLEENDIKIPAWFSFNSKDGSNVVSGDSLSECVSIADSCKKIIAVGINCTPPRFIHGLILSIRKEDWVLCRVFYKSRGVFSNGEVMERNDHEVLSSPTLPPLMESFITFESHHHLDGGSDEQQAMASFSSYPPSMSTHEAPPPPPPSVGPTSMEGAFIIPRGPSGALLGMGSSMGPQPMFDDRKVVVAKHVCNMRGENLEVHQDMWNPFAC